MNSSNKELNPSFTILMAEDDPDDRFLIARAFKELGSNALLHFVKDGEELMQYLLDSGGSPAASDAPSPPALLLLDLNMPKKDGREALTEIRANPNFLELPVVVWTTSSHEEDVHFCYEKGANSYVTKPHSYRDLVKVVRKIVNEWLPHSD
jgi:CheY-like chemotaxis protein